MTIGLIDVDGHNFPNLALMKLSAWHKAQGDIKKMEQQAITVELQDDETKIDYRMGISNGSLYFEEIEDKTAAPETGGGDSPEESGNESNEEVNE